MQLPLSFYITVTIELALIAELWRQRRQPWILPTLVVYVTILTWYYADLVLYPDKYQGMPEHLIDYAFGEVAVFSLAFRLMVPFFSEKFRPRKQFLIPRSLKPEQLLNVAIAAWVFLFICGVSRMDWDVTTALFPVSARNGNLLWLRAAAGDAGLLGFLVSTGGYLYLVTCALFGILIVVMRETFAKIIAGGMMALTWPFFLLSGTRNQFLAVGMPWVFCYALMGRQSRAVRVLVLLGCFLLVNFAFQIVVGYRNVGFTALFEDSREDQAAYGTTQTEKALGHQGLNMLEELCYENAFLTTGEMHLTWGWDYYVQASGFVPRAIWPAKPMMGIEYAKARGYGGGDSDIGVVATISTGLIGQGVLEYGPFFGPVAPALLLALWCGLLARWWQQRASLLRLGLFVLALGVTFNLGRDITNIALWPIAFAYALVRLAERCLPMRWVLAPAVPAGPAERVAGRPKPIERLVTRRPASPDSAGMGNVAPRP
jgi:hypothetical protein